MKTTLALLALVFSLATFAQEEGQIIKETWTCKNENINLSAVITAKKTVAKIDAHGSGEVVLSLDKGFNGLEDGLKTRLNGELIEHDTWNFDATLVRTGEEFEWSNKKRVVTKGQLSLITDMFIDCVGDRAVADLVECKVVIERK